MAVWCGERSRDSDSRQNDKDTGFIGKNPISLPNIPAIGNK